MTDFWSEHSKSQSVEEMMLDSKAEKLSQLEHPEVMGMLPCIKGKDVLELGAGIGYKQIHSLQQFQEAIYADKTYTQRRFTGDLAEQAGHVTAVDFMKSFIDKNREVNGAKYTNVDFLCADVTKLEHPQESYDVIFSNWLLMYLSDEEVQQLAQKMLSWLRNGGYLFFRESCYHSSGDMKNSDNPTLYRTPQKYTDLFSGVRKGAHSFEVVTKRSLETYAKHKQNKHQFSWLWKKITGMKGSLQEFLDSHQYNRDGILKYEWIFGKGFISPGGLETTKEFVGRLNLQSGQEVLDIGCGIGGCAFYMTNLYHVNVLGLDISSNMINFALHEYESSKNKLVQFEVCDVTKREFPSEKFDVVYSREVILHIQDKKSLFCNILRWLKPGGQLLVTDYCCSSGNHSEEFKAYLADRQYHLIDVDSYGKLLCEVGFEEVVTEDRTKQFSNILKHELGNFEHSRDQFVKEFSSNNYTEIVDSWRSKLVRCETGEQTWGVFYARKPAAMQKIFS